MPEHEAGGPLGTPTLEVRDFLRRRREQIAQRWADEPLFRTVFPLPRDEAVEAGKAVVDALAQVADAQRVEDSDAAGFTGVREQLARMSASRSRAGLSITQVSNELAALWPPVDRLLASELEEMPTEELRACTTTLSTLMGTLRVVAMQYAGADHSGDAWTWVRSGDRHTLMLADGLGHGPEAARASTAAVDAVRGRPHLGPAEMLRLLHVELGATRGAAVAVAQLDARSGRLWFAGIGNIGARMREGDRWRALLSRPGIVGVHRPGTVREDEFAWSADSVLFLHTDGLPSRWSPPSD
ncbi:RsbRD N-terminal domain-containing protein, partial [Streptomyces pratens]